MRSSSTRRRRIAEQDSARPAVRPPAGAAAHDNAAMRASFRETLLSLRELFFTAAPFVLLAIGLRRRWPTCCSIRRRRSTSTLATGQDQGAYAEFGRRYAQILKENGIEVRLRPTAGAAENLALLREPGGEVDIAFVQGGADPSTSRGSATTPPTTAWSRSAACSTSRSGCSIAATRPSGC